MVVETAKKQVLTSRPGTVDGFSFRRGKSEGSCYKTLGGREHSQLPGGGSKETADVQKGKVYSTLATKQFYLLIVQFSAIH